VEVNKIIQGDCLEVLKTLPDQSVNCCITSPPYWGLRNYGVDGQLGLEKTPEEYVAHMVEVFREVRRVLRDDGTVWLNLGDSYAGSGKGSNPDGTPHPSTLLGKQGTNTGTVTGHNMPQKAHEIGLKPKDLVGIPWRVAFALQQPYYIGKIKDERDRIWLAAMMDAEGSICGTEYQNCGRTKTNIYISITNTSVPIIDKCEMIFPQEVKHVYEKTNSVSSRPCFRWDVERMETKSLFLREIYPHLIAKRKQAIIGYTFTEMQRGLESKKRGYWAEQNEQRSWLLDALSKLNNGIDVDLPNWVIEPPPLFEPGFYLRQDLIWHKPNPMPESVTDRCTKAHEYIFLLSKSAKYYYDAEAIAEPLQESSIIRNQSGWNGNEERGYISGPQNHMSKYLGSDAAKEATSRNRRSVWTVTTKPFREAHFATFPPDLIEPCALAGCPESGVILDPFMGAGTTAVVAKQNYRNYIGIELNQKYIEIAQKRIDGTIVNKKLNFGGEGD
jgi:DNA modification methylase